MQGEEGVCFSLFSAASNTILLWLLVLETQGLAATMSDGLLPGGKAQGITWQEARCVQMSLLVSLLLLIKPPVCNHEDTTLTTFSNPTEYNVGNTTSLRQHKEMKSEKKQNICRAEKYLPTRYLLISKRKRITFRMRSPAEREHYM